MNITDYPDVHENLICFLRLLERYFRRWSLLTDRTDHISFFFYNREIFKMDPYWLSILHLIVKRFGRYIRSRKCSTRLCTSRNYFGGYYLIGITKDSPRKPQTLQENDEMKRRHEAEKRQLINDMEASQQAIHQEVLQKIRKKGGESKKNFVTNGSNFAPPLKKKERSCNKILTQLFPRSLDLLIHHHIPTENDRSSETLWKTMILHRNSNDLE